MGSIQHRIHARSSRGIAAVRSACILVVAARRITVYARALRTNIVCARVAVAAIRWRPGYTTPSQACVPDGAGVAVAARNCVVRMHATIGRIARIIRAEILVIAIGRRTHDARSSGALIAGGACTSVRARIGVVHVHTADRRSTAVVCADVVVVAVQRRTPDALAARTMIIGGAGVYVIAWIRVIVMEAADGLVAHIVRAGITVVAIQRRATAARTT